MVNCRMFLIATVIDPSFSEMREVNIPLENERTKALIYSSEYVTPFTRFDIKPIEALFNQGMHTFVMPPHSLLFVEFQVCSDAKNANRSVGYPLLGRERWGGF